MAIARVLALKQPSPSHTESTTEVKHETMFPWSILFYSFLLIIYTPC